MSSSQKKIIIAIDGPSACGKSTLANDLANSLAYRHLDTGAMYRAVTHFFLTHKIDLKDPVAVERATEQIDIRIHIGDDKQSIVALGEMELKDELRSHEVNKMVSTVAALPRVRERLVTLQRSIGKDGGIVMDGRDIGSIVFPGAELKIFLTACLDKRVERRTSEILTKGLNPNHSEIRANLLHRDHIDSTRKHSPLIMTDDAVVIDNTNLSREEQLAVVLALVRMRIESLSD